MIGGQLQTQRLPLNDFLSTDFKVITTTTLFPVGVDTNQVMANPGDSWNSTCMRWNGIPNQCLIFAGKSDSLWFVYYEQGGLRCNTILLLFKPTASGFETLWVGDLYFSQKKKNLMELKEVMTKSRFLQYSEDHGSFIESEIVLVKKPISKFQVHLRK
jgi:hypothetical protein